MKTLYEILEVSENASEEIIEKAYKVLAKKYHPDLQQADNKVKAEEKMKEINDAYDILSNKQKRENYDNELSEKREEEKRKIINQAVEYKAEGYNNSKIQNQYDKVQDMRRRRYEEQLRRNEQQMRSKMEQNMQQEYQNAYYNYLRSLGYRIKEKWTWKRTKELIITLLIIVLIFTAIWYFPPTNKLLVDFYENNPIVHSLVDIVIAIVKAIFDTIVSIF